MKKTYTVAVAGTALAGVSKLVGAIYDQQSQQVVVQSDTAQLEQKFDNVITLLSLMLGVNQDQLKALQSQGGINLSNLMNQMGIAQTTHNYQSI